jgi:hypothetical protein
MVREPDATRQPTPHDNQLMSKHRVLSLKPQLRLEWRDQNETEQPDHSASLGDSITSSTRIRFSDPKLHMRHRLDPIDLCVRHTSVLANAIFRLALPWIVPVRYDATLKLFPNYKELW